MRYDMRPDRVGWTVFDIATGRPVVLGGQALTGLEEAAADELVDLLNRDDQERFRRRPARAA